MLLVLYNQVTGSAYEFWLVLQFNWSNVTQSLLNICIECNATCNAFPNKSRYIGALG